MGHSSAASGGASTTCCTLWGWSPRTPFRLHRLHQGSLTASPLTQEQYRLYRSCVGSLIYISHDRPDILWDIGLVSGRLSAPHDIDMKRLARVAR